MERVVEPRLTGLRESSGPNDLPSVREAGRIDWDLARTGVRALNQYLHHDAAGVSRIRVLNPNGEHHIAAGLDAPLSVDILGHAGYFIAGMNQQADVTVHGNVGWSVAENMMSGTVRVHGCASECAGSSGQGGLLVVDGDVSSRCGISLKGLDIVVGGSVGHMSAFMAQAGTLVVLGDAGDSLGDSIYEAHLYVRGTVAGLGADCIEKPLADRHRAELHAKLQQAGLAGQVEVAAFRRYGSARQLYHFHVDHADAY